jgi:N-methylhydantoinase B
MREAILNVPDGVYASEGIVEQMEGKDDIVIKAAVRVKESDIMVDLAGSSPQVDWGGNVVYNFTYAYVFMAMKSMFDPDIPNNDGCTAPISMEATLGSVVNCKFPAAVAARMQIGHFITEIIYRAMADVLPDRVIAGSGGTPANMNVLYARHRDGCPWYSVRIRGGGYGEPLEREEERVEADVRDGYVSLEAAENSYGVIIDPETGLADAMATEKKRESMRGDRKTPL